MPREGSYVTTSVAGERVRAFVPPPLPPDPPLALASLLRPLERADQALGRLDGVAALLPDPALFIYFYVRKEAVLSSQIEGTQSSLSDLLLFELDEPGLDLVDDVAEVSNYVAAMHHGLWRLREGFPLSLRLIREIHAVLLRGGRGADKTAGEFRRSQNWIGGARPGTAIFVPPPHQEVMSLMGQLETFLHERVELPVLVRAGLAHVQFETIHPFLDGNGRLGRLLVTFLLCTDGVLREPLLYLSLFLKQHRETYYDLLQRVRTQGAWEAWFEFFLEGVDTTASAAGAAAHRMLDLFREDRARSTSAFGQAAGNVLRVLEHFQYRPISTIQKTSAALGLTFPTVSAAVRRLEELGILREVTGRKRDRIFAYGAYLDLLAEGTEPLPR